MTPLWRQPFDAIERPITAVSESWVQSDLFMDLTAAAFRVERRLTGDMLSARDATAALAGRPPVYCCSSSKGAAPRIVATSGFTR